MNDVTASAGDPRRAHKTRYLQPHDGTDGTVITWQDIWDRRHVL